MVYLSCFNFFLNLFLYRDPVVKKNFFSNTVMFCVALSALGACRTYGSAKTDASTLAPSRRSRGVAVAANCIKGAFVITATLGAEYKLQEEFIEKKSGELSDSEYFGLSAISSAIRSTGLVYAGALGSKPNSVKRIAVGSTTALLEGALDTVAKKHHWWQRLGNWKDVKLEKYSRLKTFLEDGTLNGRQIIPAGVLAAAEAGCPKALKLLRTFLFSSLFNQLFGVNAEAVATVNGEKSEKAREQVTTENAKATEEGKNATGAPVVGDEKEARKEGVDVAPLTSSPSPSSSSIPRNPSNLGSASEKGEGSKRIAGGTAGQAKQTLHQPLLDAINGYKKKERLEAQIKELDEKISRDHMLLIKEVCLAEKGLPMSGDVAPGLGIDAVSAVNAQQLAAPQVAPRDGKEAAVNAQQPAAEQQVNAAPGQGAQQDQTQVAANTGGNANDAVGK